MGRNSFNIRRLWADRSSDLPERRLRGRGESRLALICSDTMTAIGAFATLIAADERPTLKSELHAARATLDRALALAREEPSRSPSDLRSKCRVYRELAANFPESDERLRAFARDLTADLTELLEGNLEAFRGGYLNGSNGATAGYSGSSASK